MQAKGSAEAGFAAGFRHRVREDCNSRVARRIQPLGSMQRVETPASFNAAISQELLGRVPVLHLRQKRLPNGFWVDPPGLGRPPGKISVPELGLLAALKLEGSVLPILGPLAFERGHMCWWDASSHRLVAVAEFAILTQAFGALPNRTILTRLDDFCPEAGQFARVLRLHFVSLRRLIIGKYSVVHLKRLEMAPIAARRGQGADLGMRLMRTLDALYKVNVFLMETLPLQYVRGTTQAPEGTVLADEEPFRAARTKLVRIVERRWGGVRLSSDFAGVSFRNDFKRNPDQTWRCILRSGVGKMPR